MNSYEIFYGLDVDFDADPNHDLDQGIILIEFLS